MKNSNKFTRKVALSFALVFSLIFGISASPAFASLGDSSSAASSAADQQQTEGVDSDDQGSSAGSEGGISQPEDGDDSEGADEGEGTGGETGQPEAPKGPLEIIAGIPGVIVDELGSMFNNAINPLSDDDNGKQPRKTYNKIWYSGEKLWKNADGTNAEPPVDEITIRIEGYADLNNDGVISASEKAADKKHMIEDEKGDLFYDADGDGAYTINDKYFDIDKNGSIDSDESKSDNTVVAPYQAIEVKVRPDYKGNWEYSTDNLEADFYETMHSVVKDESGEEQTLGTLYFVTENGEPKTWPILYSASEDPVNGFSSSLKETDYDPPYEQTDNTGDGGTTNKVITFTNTAKPSLDKTGAITINKTYQGPVYANSGSTNPADPNTGNTVTAVFHIVGKMYANGEAGTGEYETVFDGYRALNFLGNGERAQSITVENLPVGAWYTVTEVQFDGCGYTPVGDSEKTFRLLPDVVQPDEGDDDGATEGDGSPDAEADNQPGEGTEGDAAGSEGDGETGDDTGTEGDDVESARPTATHTVNFTNKATLEETPNQGWVNRYSPTDNGYTITPIRITAKLQ